MASNNNGFHSVSKTNVTEADPLSMLASEASSERSASQDNESEKAHSNVGSKADKWFGSLKKNMKDAAKSVKASVKEAKTSIKHAVDDYKQKDKDHHNSSDSGFDPVVPVSDMDKEYMGKSNLEKKTVRIDEGAPTSARMRSPSEEDYKEREYSTATENLPLLTGEKTTMVHQDAYVQYGPGKMIPGSLHMTNYRIRFVPTASHMLQMTRSNPSVHSWLNIPLACIDRIDKERKPKDSKQTGITVLFTCKDVRQHRITIQPTNDDDNEVDRAIATMAAYAFPNNMKYLFAFTHMGKNAETHSLLYNPQDHFNIMEEYTRQGMLSDGENGASRWRLTDANGEYRLCNSYPKALIVPAEILDEDLFIVSAFRSGQRIPVLTWGNKQTGATLWRSSQPKAGVSGSNIHDELYLDIIASSQDPSGYSAAVERMRDRARSTVVEKNRKPLGETYLHIVDCRPMASAMANRAAGAGYESHANYPNCRLEFYNIPNIHVMRDAYRQMMSIMQNHQTSDVNFTKLLEDTQWLHYSRLILKAGHETASVLNKGIPVLVHCSHGWDRTPQVCALAQIFLDPFYRSFDGFKVVVEKEWCAFGHQYQMRCAHSQDRTTRQEDQFSPVFLQFLDCVWQILKQNPHYFEFNSRFILTIADSIYSGRFGTFLFSTDQERDGLDAKKKTLSVWTYLRRNRHIFTNPLYLDPDEHTHSISKVLLPPLPTLLRNVKLWDDYFLRWSNVPCMTLGPEQLSKYMYDSHGFMMPSLTEEEARRCKMTYKKEDDNETRDRSTTRESYSNTDAYNPHDWDVPTMVTSDDFWESAYRMERQGKDIEQSMNRLKSNLSSPVGSGRTGRVRLASVSQSRSRRTTKSFTAESADLLSGLVTNDFSFESTESFEQETYVSPSKRASRKNSMVENRIIMQLTHMLREKGVSQEEITAVVDAAEGSTAGSITSSLFNMRIDDSSSNGPSPQTSPSHKLSPADAILAADLIPKDTSSHPGIFDDDGSNLESVPGRPSDIPIARPSLTPTGSEGNLASMAAPTGEAQDVDDDHADEDSVFSTDDHTDDASTRAFCRTRRASGAKTNNHRVRIAQYNMSAASNTASHFDDMSHNSSTTDATEMADSQLSDSSDNNSMAVLR
jgi:myotubularin-related protein 1/2